MGKGDKKSRRGKIIIAHTEYEDLKRKGNPQ